MTEHVVDQEARDMAKSVAAGLVSHERVCNELNKHLEEWKRTIEHQISDGFKAAQRAYQIGQDTMLDRFEGARTVDNDRNNKSAITLAENVRDSLKTVMDTTMKLYADTTNRMTEGFNSHANRLTESIKTQNQINLSLDAKQDKLATRQDRVFNWLIGVLLTLSGSVTMVLVGFIVREIFVRGPH